MSDVLSEGCKVWQVVPAGFLPSLTSYHFPLLLALLQVQIGQGPSDIRASWFSLPGILLSQIILELVPLLLSGLCSDVRGIPDHPT